MAESRKRNTIKSAAVNIVDQCIVLVFGLIVPRLVIGTYGSSVNGLTSFVSQILSVFQLLQAGTVGASIYALFKPIANNDYEQINIIVDSSRRFFNKVGAVFFACVFALVPIMIYTQRDSGFQLWEIAATTLIMGVNGGLAFFFNARYDIVLSSYQKRYILYTGNIIQKFVYYGFLLTAVLTKQNFVLMYVASLVGNISCIIFLRHFYIKLIKPWEKTLKVNNFHVPNKGYLFSNQIVQTVINSLPVILVSSFYGLAQNSVYSLNNSIVNIAKTVLFAFMYAVTEPFGNYVQGKTSTEVYKMFDKIQYGMIYAETFIMTCVVCLLNPFIKLYTIGISDINYDIPILVVFLVVDATANVLYRIALVYIDVYGWYKELYSRMIVAGVIGILLMVLSGKFLGFQYIPLASSVYYALITCVCYFITAHHDKILVNIKQLVARLSVLYGTAISAYIITKNLFKSIKSWSEWIIMAIILAFIIIIELLLLTALFERSKFLVIKNGVKKLFHRK